MRPHGPTYARWLHSMIALGLINGSLLDRRHYRKLSIGPEPHVFTPEEGQEIARQIAAERRAKRRR